MNELIYNFFLILAYAFNFAVLGRVVMSWIVPDGKDPMSQMLHQITEPVLSPIRRILPSTGMFDLSPMIALLLLNFIVVPVIKNLL